jgi:hypothetical protein
MESYLKRLVWDADAACFQDPEKGGWEPVGEKPFSTGGKPGYTRSRPEAKKLIPV